MQMAPTPEMGPVKQIDIEKPPLIKKIEERINNCRSFEELFSVIDRLDNIPGSAGQSNAAEDLIKKIAEASKEIKEHQLQPGTPETDIILSRITRTGGLRQKVSELIFSKEDPKLTEKINKASTAEELIAVLEKVGGIARSDGKIIKASLLKSLIEDLKSKKELGIEAASPIARVILDRITRNAGLRDKVEKIIFG